VTGVVRGKTRATARLLALAALCSSGCAFGARHVDLTYGSSLPAIPSAAATRGRIAVARLDDARVASQGTGTLLGKVRNGYGIPTASVVANQDPVLWVTEGVARSLAAQGFDVVRIGSPADVPELPTFGGRVTRASGGMYMAMDANVAADLDLVQRGRVLARFACNGRASRVAWTASADEYRRVFEAAMSDFASACGPRLTRALAGEPVP
jgi:hypothetical protein